MWFSIIIFWLSETENVYDPLLHAFASTVTFFQKYQNILITLIKHSCVASTFPYQKKKKEENSFYYMVYLLNNITQKSKEFTKTQSS